MTQNRVARKDDKHFCPSHGITEILAVEEWFKINDAPVICDGDLTGCGARLIASANFFTVNGRAAVRRGDTSDHSGLVIDGAEVSEFFQEADTMGLVLPAGGRRPPPNVIAFVKAHYRDTKDIAEALGTTPALLLGISGLETGWGTSDIAREGNNFFGQHSRHPYEIGSRVARQNNKVRLSIFENYRMSVKSFSEVGGVHIRGIQDPITAAQILQDKRLYAIDTITGKPNPKYPGDLKTVTDWCESAILLLKDGGSL